MRSAKFILGDAVEQDLHEIVTIQLSVGPDALTVHVDIAAVRKHDAVPTCDGLSIQLIGCPVHCIGILLREQDFICDNDRQDWISADDRDKDDAFNIVVLVNGNVGVAVFFHNIQASPNDRSTVFIDSAFAFGHTASPQSGVSADDTSDQAECHAGLFIHAADLEADGVKLAGDLLGVVELGFGIHSGLESDEDESIVDAGDDSVVVGAWHKLTQCRQIGVLGCCFDGESDITTAKRSFSNGRSSTKFSSCAS